MTVKIWKKMKKVINYIIAPFRIVGNVSKIMKITNHFLSRAAVANLSAKYARLSKKWANLQIHLVDRLSPEGKYKMTFFLVKTIKIDLTYFLSSQITGKIMLAKQEVAILFAIFRKNIHNFIKAQAYTIQEVKPSKCGTKKSDLRYFNHDSMLQ